MAIPLIKGFPLIERVSDVLGLDSNMVSRVVIDAKYDDPVMVYVEVFGSEEMIELILPDIQKADVKIVSR